MPLVLKFSPLQNEEEWQRAARLGPLSTILFWLSQRQLLRTHNGGAWYENPHVIPA
jgi:hypothetical protein